MAAHQVALNIPSLTFMVPMGVGSAASVGLPYLRSITVWLESVLPGFPLSSFWVDYFSYNRTCPVDIIPRVFGFLPARFSYRLDYLRNVNWRKIAMQTLFKRKT